MALGRRAIRLQDETRWVFNRMADVYEARPPYPEALIGALVGLAATVGTRVLDLGAGVGHLALPLSARGLQVTAVEPARAMLQRLQTAARKQRTDLRCLHARAEDVPVDDGSADLVIISDALHFLDAEHTGHELLRVLAPGGALVILTCTLTHTPFMSAVIKAMEDAAPRRPRITTKAATQIAALTGVTLGGQQCYHDQTPVDHDTLERILRSISFIGPAMNEQRFAAFRERVRKIPLPPQWARTFAMRTGLRT